VYDYNFPSLNSSTLGACNSSDSLVSLATQPTGQMYMQMNWSAKKIKVSPSHTAHAKGCTVNKTH